MFNFKDLHSFNGHNVYPCSNEDAQIHKSLLTKLGKVPRIGGICGGGDIGFISLLPSLNARGKLLLIDHSYASMSGALLKYLILERHTPDEVKKLLTEDAKGLFNLIDKLKKELPTEMQSNSGILVNRSRYDQYSGNPLSNNTYHFAHDLYRIWSQVTEEEIAQIQRKLHQITFLHGDLNDFFKKGPFDVIYTSNALTFHGRNGAVTDIGKLKKSLKPGGHVLTTNRSCVLRGFHEIAQKNGMDGSTSTQRTSWHYLLLQKPSD